MRIISLLPAATEIVAALGLVDHLVGVSHECDYPAGVNDLPRVMTCPIYHAGLTSAEIDARVRESIERGESLYEIDVDLVRALKPDLVLTQMLCDVCAIGYGTVASALATIDPRPRLVNLEPRRLDDLYANIRDVATAVDAINSLPLGRGGLGRGVGVNATADGLIAGLLKRLDDVARRTAQVQSRPRVLFLEWIDPLFAAGHWTPELIDLAGGECVVGRPRVPSTTVEWRDAVATAPDVIVVACCGYSVEQIEQDLPILAGNAGWSDLPAVCHGHVYAIDGSHYFNRPGPRLIESLEILGATLHPEIFPEIDTAGRVYCFANVM